MDTDEIAYRSGDILAGKYKVERVIGLGGFGAVLSATHLQLEERVAIKVLLPHAAKNAAAAERFLREARAAVRIRSEHVARVTDVGKLHDTVPYMVMEFLEGQDLSAVLKSQGCQPVTDVMEWVLQACEALAEAHSLGIVHRDLKPANLFLTRKVDGAPCIKVLDFGISKMTNENGDKGMTKTSDVMGSPFYMSPEQMRSTRSVDARSDIWALGAILFEMLAGAPPFDAETMTALVVSIMQEPPRDLGLFRRDIPPAVRDIIMRCLQKDPAQRFPDVASLAGALAAFAPQRAQINLQRVMAIAGRASNPLIGRASAVPGSGPQQPQQGQVDGSVSGNLTMAGAPASVAFGQSGHAHAQSGHQNQGGHGQYGHGHHDSGGYQQQPAMGVSYGSDPGQMGPGMVGPTQPGSYGPGNLPPGMLHMGSGASPAQSWGGTYMGSKKQGGSKAALIVGVIALGVVLIGGGGGIYYVVTNDEKPVKHARNDDDDDDTVNRVAAANTTSDGATSASATASSVDATAPDGPKPGGSDVALVTSSAPANNTTPPTPTTVASSSPPPAPSSAPVKPSATSPKPQPTPEPTLPPIIIVTPTQTQPPPQKTNRPPNDPLFGQPD